MSHFVGTGMLHNLRKVREYLFKDFEFHSNFGDSLDYESYWQAREQTGNMKAKEISESQKHFKLNLIASLIEPKTKVLDIGCGDGSLLAFLKQSKDIYPYGIEISPTACKLAQEKGIKVFQKDITKESLPTETFDYIIMSEVLEHLTNPVEILLQLNGHFSHRLLITIPNTGAINDRLRLLFGRFPKQWILHPSEHLHFWTVTDFLFLCRQLGFKVEKVYGLYDPYYNLGCLKLWKSYPKLFTRYILYEIKESKL